MAVKIFGVKRKCTECKSVFKPLSHNHSVCSGCSEEVKANKQREYNEDKREEGVADKLTWRYKRPGTLSRSQQNRRNK